MNRFNITKLDSGIKVITEHIPYVKSFSLGFWFDVGSRDEIPLNNGISHFLEHMFFKGTTNRSAKKIADDIESLGGYLNAFTSKEHTCFYGRGLSQHLPKTFEVLADMIQNPLFRSKDIKNESGVIIDELNDIEDSPEELIFDKLEGCIYKKNPLSLPIIGSEKNIKSFTRENLLNFISSHYGLDKLYIVASGNVDHNRILDLTGKYFNKKLGKAGQRKKVIKTQTGTIVHVNKDIQQAHVVLGKGTYGVKSKERIKVSLLSHLLGEGSGSRLFQSLREKNGITYQVNTFLNSFSDVSSFGIYFSTNEKSMVKAQRIIQSEFTKLQNKKVSVRELKRAKEYLKGNLLLSLESTTNRMLRIAQSMIYTKKIKSMDEIILQIDTVTPDDIIELSRQLLDYEKFNKVIISSKNLLYN